jgi:hypothetical protein
MGWKEDNQWRDTWDEQRDATFLAARHMAATFKISRPGEVIRLMIRQTGLNHSRNKAFIFLVLDLFRMLDQAQGTDQVEQLNSLWRFDGMTSAQNF